MSRSNHDSPVPLEVVALRSQVPVGVLAIGAEPVRLTWRVEPATDTLHQLAYECEAAESDDFAAHVASTGPVESAEQVAVVAPGAPLRSREVRHYRVRIRTEAGWTAWSPTLRVEAGLLEASDWSAQAITLPDDPGRDGQAPSPVLRREFEVAGDVLAARLSVTSLGLHRVLLNGQPVSEDVLAPGWTAYRHRLLAETYDVTDLLTSGANVLLATLGDGWYRGRLGWTPQDDRAKYGRDVALIAQLEIELADGNRQVVVSDEGWSATTTEVRAADLYDGSDVDLREARPGAALPGCDTSEWASAAIVPFDLSRLEPRMAPPVRVVDVLQPAERPLVAGGTLRLDAGQNISGWVRLRVRGTAGTRVTVRHAEVREADGSLHTRALRSARATDTYTLADDTETVLEPVFTFHGFRYAEVETEAEVLEVAFVAISSDTPRRGHYSCSDERLTKLHENVVWSQRDNFVSVPTDCPQRDERLGWTGDAQAFAATACTLFDAEAFWRSWLIDLALDQDPVRGVPSVVPDVVLTGEGRFGRAGWADAATMVPWAVYEAYGDREVLRRQYASMRAHVESLRARRGPDGLLGEGMQFGDWLDPDAPVDRPWEAKADSRYLANAYLVLSASLLARAAELLGRASDAAESRALAESVRELTWATWAEHAVASQTGAAVALQLGIAPEAERADVAAELARHVREADGRVATGFLGTPLVLPALAEAGFLDEAYRMLLRTEVPSWLYQVVQGATTVWERWDAILPDGSIHPGTMTAPPEMPDSDRDDGAHMLSFNHYAYGAVVDWVYRHVAGIAPDGASPGYRHVRFEPKPVEGMSWAEGSVETAYGRVSIEWRVDEHAFVATVELPFGTNASFVAPATAASRVEVDGLEAAPIVPLGPGRHRIVVREPRLAAGRSGREPTGATMAAAS
jgi:alpha-L-rhamnosidase